MNQPPIHVLITGPSGSGKSYFGSALAAQGYPAFDSDAIPGLAAWYDTSGRRVTSPARPDAEFLTTHRYLWDAHMLSGFLRDRRQALVFGIAHNSAALAGMFDFVFLLRVPIEQVLKNLRNASRANAFGASAEHQAMARADTEAFYLGTPSDWRPIVPTSPAAVLENIERITGRLFEQSPN